jgi:hypothetical protein
MNLENSMLSKRGYSEKITHYMIPFMRCPEEKSTKLVVSRSWKVLGVED